MLSRRSVIRLGSVALAAPLVMRSARAQARGSVSGRAVDQDGLPLGGIHVEAVNLSIPAHRLPSYGRSIKAEGKTGGDGRYRLDLAGLPPGEYRAKAFETVRNGSREVIVELTPDTAAGFASNETVVRDFRRLLIEESPEHPYGNGGIFVLENAVMDYTDLGGAEVTLAPVGRGGKPIVRRVRRTGEGLVVTGVPFGIYRASARLGGRSLLLRLWGPGVEDRYAASVEHDFTMGYLGNQFRVLAKSPDG